jgi:LAO/AO transport system kinase
VGQSETAVAGMTDMFVLMQLPNAGDDLQAIKKGVMELADLVLINKADIDPDAATRAQAQITSSLRIITQHWRLHHMPRVLQLSALKSQGVEAFWQAVGEYRETRDIAARRRHQSLDWMWQRIESGLRQAFRQHPEVRRLLPGVTREVEEGKLAASTAARQLLARAKTENEDAGHPGTT